MTDRRLHDGPAVAEGSEADAFAPHPRRPPPFVRGCPGQADDRVWRHATSLNEEPKYPPDFKHFDYVNTDAPKGGLVRLSDTGGFDTLNPILSKGNPAPGLGLIYETLMTSALDEVRRCTASSPRR